MVTACRTITGRPWSKARWLILAPHPDDETLGAGALVSEVGPRGRLIRMIYLTDGAGSHPVTKDCSRGDLVAIRKREARAALRRLAGPNASEPLFLDWRDGRPYGPGEPGYARAARQLAKLCDAKRIDAIAVTAAHEPHCDHSAACGLAHAVAGAAHRPVAVFEYLVWADTPPPTGRAFRTQPMLAGRRRAALAAHRSQLTPLHGAGFRLPVERRRMDRIDRLFLRSGRNGG